MKIKNRKCREFDFEILFDFDLKFRYAKEIEWWNEITPWRNSESKAFETKLSSHLYYLDFNTKKTEALSDEGKILMNYS